jgi:hypothetical protein
MSKFGCCKLKHVFYEHKEGFNKPRGTIIKLRGVINIPPTDIAAYRDAINKHRDAIAAVGDAINTSRDASDEPQDPFDNMFLSSPKAFSSSNTKRMTLPFSNLPVVNMQYL